MYQSINELPLCFFFRARENKGMGAEKRGIVLFRFQLKIQLR
jgi:hypothetical protein